MSDCTCCAECRAFCDSLETNGDECTGCWCDYQTDPSFLDPIDADGDE